MMVRALFESEIMDCCLNSGSEDLLDVVVVGAEHLNYCGYQINMIYKNQGSIIFPFYKNPVIMFIFT